MFPENPTPQVGTGGYEVEETKPKAKTKAKTTARKPLPQQTEIDKELELSIEEQIAKTSKLFPAIKEPVGHKEIEMTNVEVKEEGGSDA